MMNLEQIIALSAQDGIPAERPRQAMAEYLQCLILQSLLKAPLSDKLSFIGGTCLRFFYGLPRFSEDLDFDNFGLQESEFTELLEIVIKDLKAQGFVVDSLIKIKGAYHCYVRFANLLYENKLSPHADEKILVKVDTVQQDFVVKPQRKFFNRYGMAEEVAVNPIDILMAQKVLAILGRNTSKGRDFFDFVFLDGLTKPNLEYLRAKTGIESLSELKKRLLARCEEINFADMVRDVQPFLFNAQDTVRISKFKQYVEGWNYLLR